MIYYYIPDFFWHYNLNVKLLELIQNKPEMFYDDFKIGAVFGNFPNCIWNGGRTWNGRHSDVKEHQYISQVFNSYGVPLRLTMTNNFITETDCYDRFANYIMKNCENGFNQVLVANPMLEEHIRKNYPKYPIIRSIIAAQEGELYDTSDEYFMTVLKKTKNNDLEYLKSIEKKDKVEILVNEVCNPDCKMVHHYEGLNRLQLYEDNCGEELYLECPYDHTFDRQTFYNHPYCITRDKIKEIYEPMGFQHFKISGRGPTYKALVLDYAHYMVRPEYKEDFIVMMIDAILADGH